MSRIFGESSKDKVSIIAANFFGIPEALASWVRQLWLTEGKGDMFTSTPKTIVDEIAEDCKLDEIDKKIIEKYLELDDEQRSIIKEYIKSIFS